MVVWSIFTFVPDEDAKTAPPWSVEFPAIVEPSMVTFELKSTMTAPPLEDEFPVILQFLKRIDEPDRQKPPFPKFRSRVHSESSGWAPLAARTPAPRFSEIVQSMSFGLPPLLQPSPGPPSSPFAT